MKPYLRSASAGQMRADANNEFDDSLEGSMEPLHLTRKKEAIQTQKKLHAAKKLAKDHARSQGSLMATLIRRADQTLHVQLTDRQLEINKMKAAKVKEDRENRKFRKPTMFDVSMEREKEIELIHELSRSVSREDIKMLTLQAKESEDMVEPYLRYVQNNNANNNNLDDFLLSINAERVIERIRPSSAKPSHTLHSSAKERPYSAAAAATYASSSANPVAANTTAVRVRPSLSAPKMRPTSAGSVNHHLVRYDLTNMHSPRGVDNRAAYNTYSSHNNNTGSNGTNGNRRGRRPSMSDSIDSNMIHIEDTDYFNADPRLPVNRGIISSGGGGAVSAASAAHYSPPNHTPATATTSTNAPPALVETALPLNIHIDLPSIAVSKYIHSSADYSPDSRTTLSISPLKTPLSTKRRVKSAGAASGSNIHSKMGESQQRPPLHHNYGYSGSLMGVQNYTTISTTTAGTQMNSTTHYSSSSGVLLMQPSNGGGSVINTGSHVLDESGVVLSESHRDLSGTIGLDSHREIFGYTPAASLKQSSSGNIAPTGAERPKGRLIGAGGTPEGIAADIINDLEEGDPFLLDELLLNTANNGNAGNGSSPNSPTLSHSKSRRIFPTVELQSRQKNQQQGVDDALVCAFMRSEMSPTKPQQQPSSNDGRPRSSGGGAIRSPLSQRIQQPRWK